MNIEQPLSDKDPVKEVGYNSFMNLIRNGHLQCAWVDYRQVYLTYISYKSTDPRSAASKTAGHHNRPISSIYEIIHRFE